VTLHNLSGRIIFANPYCIIPHGDAVSFPLLPGSHVAFAFVAEAKAHVVLSLHLKRSEFRAFLTMQRQYQDFLDEPAALRNVEVALVSNPGRVAYWNAQSAVFQVDGGHIEAVSHTLHFCVVGLY
jgi:hypothetical protein